MRNRIREIRVSQNMTQSELSAKAGVSRTIISQLETGNRDVIKSSTMVKISEALNRSIGDIFLS